VRTLKVLAQGGGSILWQRLQQGQADAHAPIPQWPKGSECKCDRIHAVLHLGEVRDSTLRHEGGAAPGCRGGVCVEGVPEAEALVGSTGSTGRPASSNGLRAPC